MGTHTDWIRFLVVKPVYSGSSPRLDMGAYIFLDLFHDLMTLFFQWYATCLLAARRMWWLRQSRDLPVQLSSSEVLIEVGRACVHRGKCALVYVNVCVDLVCVCIRSAWLISGCQAPGRYIECMQYYHNLVAQMRIYIAKDRLLLLEVNKHNDGIFYVRLFLLLLNYL